jgi:hypothetical protein
MIDKGSAARARQEWEKAGVKINASPEDGRRLIQRLISDDEFRSKFEENTSIVLAEYNISFPEGTLPGKINLPTKEEMKKALEEYQEGYPFGKEQQNIAPLVWLVIFIVFIPGEAY